MNIQAIEIREVLRDIPPRSRRALGVASSAAASYYATEGVLILLGESTAPLMDWVGATLACSILMVVGAIALLSRRVVLVNLAFLVVAFGYILFALRFANGNPLAVMRQIVFHTLPFALNAVLLVQWLRATEPTPTSQ